MRGFFVLVSASLVFGLACGDERPEDDGTQMSTLTIDPSAGTGATSISLDDDGNDTEKLDASMMGTEGPVPCAEGGNCDECVEYQHVPCDQGSTDIAAALGLNCPNEATMTVSTAGPANAIGVRSNFGALDNWPAREGSVFAVIGSGNVAELDSETPTNDSNAFPTQCNDDLGPAFDGPLPAPILVNNVTGDCATDNGLLGTGDCSNTIEGQFSQGGGANDYVEIRLLATVPEGNNSLDYDFAFFSTEYPDYYGSGFNDMYIGWLESESWTGNISFDASGQPISLNAGFLDYRDAPNGAPLDPMCAGGCVAPELHGTCMKQHAGTKWLSSTAPVTPGENITLVLAIFDLSDSILDSYVFLDNFGWGCEGTDTPTTVPVG
jgi:hypothetical protein